MDTKLRGNPKIVRLVSMVLLVATAVGFVSLFPFLRREAQSRNQGFFEREEFVEQLYRDSFVLYWRLRQEENNDIRHQEQREGRVEEQMTPAITPADVFFPAEVAALQKRAGQGDEQAAAFLVQLEESSYITYFRMVDVYFQQESAGMEYLVVDNSNYSQDSVMGTGGEALAHYVTGLLSWRGTDEAELAEQYQYYAVLQFDSFGNVSVAALHGASAESLEYLTLLEPNWWSGMLSGWRENGEDYAPDDAPPQAVSVEDSYADYVAWQAAVPKDITVAFAVPQTATASGWNSISYQQQWYFLDNLGSTGIYSLFAAAMCIAGALGLAAALLASTGNGIVSKIPFEFAAAMAFLPAALSQAVVRSLVRASSGDSLFRLGIGVDGSPVVWPPAGQPSIAVGYVLCFLYVLALLAVVYGGLYSMGQVRATGLRQYLLRRCLIIRFFAWCGSLVRRVGRWLLSVDLTDKGDRTVVKIVSANFVIITLCSCFWFFGIIGTVIYSAVLFIILRRYFRNLKHQYQSLLRQTREMAAGRLDAVVDEDLGLFQPLGRELQTIREGFRKAVEDEVKSRSMKTELVANVSHDLKTPLTAIITYVGLLKNEGITEGERREYIDTLDKKSQRLKRLIEDLFEMSKATTGNLTLEVAPVDLPSLLRQVELELETEIQSSGVEFRNRFSEERATALLDGERTYRVFENLLLNVTKYALAGTRAYVDVITRGGNVTVKISNVSREPLDFDAEDITERFVRGDRSRGTEGSGLGLAIAKSLVELQNGRLSVSVDGDLFKVTVVFPESIAQ